jgi:prophage regulatory protein
MMHKVAVPTLQKVIRKSELPAYTGLRKTQLEFLVAKGRFPKPIHISDRRVGWLENDIAAWQQELVKERAEELVKEKK